MGEAERSIRRLWTTKTTNAPIEVHVAGPFTGARLRCLSEKYPRKSVDDLLSLGFFPHTDSHALFTLEILEQGDGNEEDKEKLEMKWLVLACVVIMLLRSVSGKCNSCAACDDQDRGRDDSLPYYAPLPLPLILQPRLQSLSVTILRRGRLVHTPLRCYLVL